MYYPQQAPRSPRPPHASLMVPRYFAPAPPSLYPQDEGQRQTTSRGLTIRLPRGAARHRVAPYPHHQRRITVAQRPLHSGASPATKSHPPKLGRSRGHRHHQSHQLHLYLLHLQEVVALHLQSFAATHPTTVGCASRVSMGSVRPLVARSQSVPRRLSYAPTLGCASHAREAQQQAPRPAREWHQHRGKPQSHS